MDKRTLIAHRDALISTEAAERLHEDATGGSSGTPLRFYYRPEDAAVLNGGLWRANEWFGCLPGRRLARIWGVAQPGERAGCGAIWSSARTTSSTGS